MEVRARKSPRMHQRDFKDIENIKVLLKDTVDGKIRPNKVTITTKSNGNLAIYNKLHMQSQF